MSINPTAIHYPYYHDGICFNSAAELQEHLDKAKPVAPVRRTARRLAAAGTDTASNVEELAAGLAGANLGESKADQPDTEAE